MIPNNYINDDIIFVRRKSVLQKAFGIVNTFTESELNEYKIYKKLLFQIILHIVFLPTTYFINIERYLEKVDNLRNCCR